MLQIFYIMRYDPVKRMLWLSYSKMSLQTHVPYYYGTLGFPHDISYQETIKWNAVQSLKEVEIYKKI